MKTAKKIGRPLKGDSARELNSIRLDKKEKALLIERFGSVQLAIDSILGKTKKEKK